jgi:Domain of unknown function (DUF4351)
MLCERLESLGEALLDFTQRGDLLAWLDNTMIAPHELKPVALLYN